MGSAGRSFGQPRSRSWQLGLNLVLATLVQSITLCQCFHRWKPAFCWSAEPRFALTFGATAADCANGTALQDVCGIRCCFNDEPVWMLVISTCIALAVFFSASAGRLALSLTFLSWTWLAMQLHMPVRALKDSQIFCRNPAVVYISIQNVDRPTWCAVRATVNTLEIARHIFVSCLPLLEQFSCEKEFGSDSSCNGGLVLELSIQLT
jgi:hypothetical protein